MKRYLWKLFLFRILQPLVWRADEWLHAQEIKLRESAPAAKNIARAAAPDPEFDVKASAAREKVFKKQARRPRLKYQHGEFVKVA